MTRKQQRLGFVLLSLACLTCATLLVLSALREDIVYFFSPTEIKAAATAGRLPSGKVRVGGLVESGSIEKNGEEIRFIIEDGASSLRIEYRGPLPGLFRERQGIVAEGTLNADGTFAAGRILAKHDETYMPREVAESLKRQGVWRGTLPAAPAAP